MKLTIATGPLLPVPAVRGGAVSRIWQGLAVEFAHRGHEVCIFARKYPGQAVDEVVQGVRYVRVGGFDQGRWITLDLLRDLLYASTAVWKLPEADILITNDFWLPALATRFRPRAGHVVVNANRFPKGQYFLYRGATRIAAASSAVRDAIARQAPALGDRVQVFPNPVDTRIMSPHDGSKPENPRVLLYVGRLHPEKGVHLLAAAFARIAERHPDWRLRIVGPWEIEDGGGGQSYVRRLREILRDLPAEIAEPQFDPVALAGEYRAASLFCYPSIADSGESFGLAVLEAMACGVPAIVSALDCFRDFVQEGTTGWMFDHRGGDPVSALAVALDRAMANPNLARDIGRRASAAAREFGCAEVASRYLADFQQLLEGPAVDA